MYLPTFQEVFYECACSPHFLYNMDTDCGTNYTAVNILDQHQRYNELSKQERFDLDFFTDYVINIAYVPLLRIALVKTLVP